MGYNTTIAVVSGGYGPRHIDRGFLDRKPGRNNKVTFEWKYKGSKRARKGKPPKGMEVDLHDYGTPLLVMDLANVGYETKLFNLFKEGREESRVKEIWPYFSCGVTGKYITHDCYNEPLGVHRLDQVLEALVSTMAAAKARGEKTFRRFQTALDMLSSIQRHDQYGDVYILTFGH